MNGELNRREARLNPEQRNAVDGIIQGWNGDEGEFILPIVEGPPGTGKTSVGVIASAKYRTENMKPKITYLCYTNYAADGALEDFIELGFSPNDVLRVTVRGRGNIYSNSPLSEYYIEFGNKSELTPNQRRQLQQTPILITTLYSAKKSFEFQSNPLIIIDEYSQVPPTLYFSTISKVRTASKHNPEGYTLLGDPNQLPVITTQPFLRPNIGVFIASRNDYEPHQLNLQYRMHGDICQSVNALREALNTYRLQTHESAENRTLISLGYNWNESNCPEDFRNILDPRNPCVIINTENLAGRDEVSLGNEGKGSKYFVSEARLVAKLAEYLQLSYTKENGERLLPTMLSPYSAQTGMIRSLLPDYLRNRCITIYKSQGREYPCVIISFARKNPEGFIGFLAEPEMRAQTYVACSRAKAKLIVLFSFPTFHGYSDYDLLLERSTNALVVNADRNWGEEI